MNHLSSAAQASLVLTDEQRILQIRSSPWIWYPRAVEVLDDLEVLLTHPRTHRMPNRLIVGATNNGKTAIAREFLSQHAPLCRIEDEADYVPVVYIQAPPVPDERRFNATLLDQLRIPHKINERADRMARQFLDTAPLLGVRMLMVDEIHHVLAGTPQKQRAFLNVLKFLGNELQISIVALGTDSALFALESDAQLANRFVPMALPEWKMNREFLCLLASFEETLPLRKPSHLVEIKLATHVLSMSEGTIGEIATLLQAAAIKAIESKEEHITISLLQRLKWTEPSQRRIRATELVG